MELRTFQIEWMGEVETLNSASPQYKMGLQFSESEVQRVMLLRKRRSESAGKVGYMLTLEGGHRQR